LQRIELRTFWNRLTGPTRSFPATGVVTLLAALAIADAQSPPLHARTAASEAETATAIAGETDLSAFARAFWPRAQVAGISRATYERAFAGLTADPEVIAKAERQPEFETPVGEYIGRRTGDQKTLNGLAALEAHAGDLASIAERYGVERSVIVAIWGIESNYGSHKGTMGVIRSLATLASTGKRQRYGRQQLIAALKLLEAGDPPAEGFTGSWAGAMGHTQFIPTTFEAYAVDWTGDGRRDIWDTPADALASTANYLEKSGWVAERTWGAAVSLRDGFDFRDAFGAKLDLADWQARGVSLPADADPDRFTGPLRLILPAGHQGPAFLVSKNFDAILAYNQSTAYALAVALLSDRLAGKPLAVAWPAVTPLSLADRQELQKRLVALGFDTGGTSGRIGKRTTAAIQAFQVAEGMPADGFADASLLTRLRAID
jgi:membrane-bound lytic murein transglycosylase B